MSEFSVTPQTLLTAAALVSPVGTRPASLDAAAASGTPAAGAWSLLTERTDQTLTETVSAREDLAHALNTAGTAYLIADQSAARSYRQG